ncbi:MAG: tetratricopeptide repeat protein [Nitrospirae bacterium]|nr:tetratricopeptide repeat protein [Nitrospirota bacterium]
MIVFNFRFKSCCLFILLNLVVSLNCDLPASFLTPLPAYAAEPSFPVSTSLEHGIQLLNEKKYDEALAAFAEAMVKDPGNPMPHYYTGVAYHRKGNPVAALTSLNRALNLSPGMPEAALEIGIILEENGRFDKALEAYQAAAGRKDDTPAVREANERYRKLAAAEHYRRAVRFFQEKQFEESLKELKIILTVNPEDIDALIAAGTIYQRTGRLKEAGEVFKKITEINPDHAEAFFQLAAIYDASGLYDEAVAAYQQVISLFPDNPRASEAKERIPGIERRRETRRHFEIAADLIRKEQWPEALKEMKVIIAEEPKNPNALFNLGLILHQLKEDDQALETLQQAIAIDPKFQKAHYQIGVIYDDLGNFGEAVKSYGQVLILGEKTPEAGKAKDRLAILEPIFQTEEMAGTAKEFLEKNDIAGAIKEVESLLALKKDDQKLLLSLAMLYIRGGRSGDAASNMEKVLALSPKDTNVRFLLAQLYEGLKEYKKAIDAYETVASLEKESPLGQDARTRVRNLSLKFHFEHGKKSLEAGDYEAALTDMQAILEIKPDDHVALFNSGVLYDRLNMPAEAEKQLRQALSISPDYIQAYLQLGVVLEKLRKFDEAREAYEKVLSLQKEGRESRIATSRIGQLQEQETLVTHMRKAFDLMEKKDWEGARREVNTVVEAYPNNYIGYFYLGVILNNAGFTNDAKVALKKSIEINPKYTKAHLYLGDLYVKDAEYEDAKRIYKEVISVSAESPEGEVAAVRMKQLRDWHASLTLNQGYNSNIAFRSKAQWDYNSVYSLGMTYNLARGREWYLSSGLSANNTIYYTTQLQSNAYSLSLNGIYQFPSDRTISGVLSISNSYFDGVHSYTETKFYGVARTDPRSIPTSASLSYTGLRGQSDINKLSNAEQHTLSASLIQQLTLRDSLSGSYSFSIYKNLDPIGSNYANRTHTISLSYGRSLFTGLGANLGYTISFVDYSNPDSQTLFQSFRRNTNQTLSAGFSVNLQESINVSLNYNFAYAISHTNLPPPTAEELQTLRDILATPIPTVGGGGGYYQNNIGISISTTF